MESNQEVDIKSQKVRADMTKEELLKEIATERKWLDVAGHSAYNIDIAFGHIEWLIKQLEG